MAGCFKVLFVLILMTAMGEHSVQAADHPNLSGFWTLDLNSPEATSMTAVLESQGVPMILRKVMDTMSITQEITQTRKSLTIKLNTSLFGVHTVTLFLDGRWHILNIEKLGKVDSRSFWDKNGTSLVTIMKSATLDGQKPVWTSWRYLQDEGRTLIVDHLITFDDGRKLTGKRVLRKQ
jgi:hypothetical protein